MFLCPSGEAEPAEEDEAGQLRLTEETCSYAWVAEPLKSTAMGPLASDKYIDGHRDQDGEHSGHPGGMNVLMTHGGIHWVPVNELPPEMLPHGLGR